MGYSPSEHLSNCEIEVERAKLLRKHYPDARRNKVCGRWEWSDDAALANATGFSVEVIEKKGDDVAVWERFTVTFLPYHELREGEGSDAVVVRVYASDWTSRVREWDFLERVRGNAALHAAILAELQKSR